ncbi:MAG TPA: gluconate 2-dehydrogenase subunit 3 family protein, partial [Vicinamibacteria bacterium]
MPTRRAVLQGLGLGAAAFLSPAAAQALESLRDTGDAAKTVFFGADEFALVEALTDRIIPTDAQSPGARAARVAEFVDLLLSEQDEDLQRTWREGLGAVDAAAREAQGRKFAGLDAAAQDALLAEWSRNETDPKTPLEQFFVEAKLRTIQGYYTSEIGIHKDLRY